MLFLPVYLLYMSHVSNITKYEELHIIRAGLGPKAQETLFPFLILNYLNYYYYSFPNATMACSLTAHVWFNILV